MNDTIAPALTPALANDTTFAPESKVWIYTTSRPLNGQETQAIRQALDMFTRQWTAHNQALKAAAEVFMGQFVILMVDETQAGASGCSIDKSVHFLEALGRETGIDFFERMRFAWIEEENMHFADRPQFTQFVQQGRIGPDTLVVNTLAPTRSEMENNWLVPFSRSWHKRLI
ncbi:MAG: hypothetical protein H6565_11300 [Lewinellaceae bacterium]|nr:hypothetical protein [Lewinellaceae bacterium]